MLALQFEYAGFHVVSRAALNMGISKIVFPVYRNVLALILLLPFAYFLEKKERPPIILSFLVQFFLLAVVGITANQGFYLLGLDNTSPTFASAIQNSVPAITFLMAALLRIEQVRLDRKDGVSKMVGTVLCITGASVITLYKGPTIYSPTPCPATMNDGEDCAAPPQLLSPHSVKDLLHSVDAFLFDCDGVIWKGDKLIDGVPQTLQMLRSKGKKLFFVTNNSTKSRRHYAKKKKKFHSLGISVSEEEIFSSSFAAAMFLKVHDFPREKKVYVIGEEGILEELELEGFTGLGGPEDGKKMVQLKPNCLFEHDKSVGAVVVGLDQYINYYKLQYATLCIRENPGCLFIATNRDAVGHMTDLQ